jgi:hypothetical protein
LFLGGSSGRGKAMAERSALREGTNFMKQSFSILCLAVVNGALPANAQVNVTQEHNHLSRDGLYIDSLFTPGDTHTHTHTHTHINSYG